MGSVCAKHRQRDKVQAFPHNAEKEEIDTTQEVVDEATEVSDLGGMTVNNEQLKKVIEKGRTEIKEAQEKLNSSLTTPIVDSEAKIIERGSWLCEVKDLNQRFSALPPINPGKKIRSNAMAFTVD